MPMRHIIDSHVHMEGFSDTEEVLSESRSVGVDAVVCVGSDVDSSRTALELASSFPDFYYPAIGVHPANILKVDLDAAVDFMVENIGKCVALGEVGLDYSYDFARSKDVRAKMRGGFERFLGVATGAEVPVSVHSRSAYGDALEMVVASGICGAVFHWFDGPLHVLRGVLDAGFYISASSAVGYSKGLRAVMAEAPIERILVETDSPVFLRGLDRLSRPVDVVGVVEALAELKEMEVDEVARVTSRNTERVFGL